MNMRDGWRFVCELNEILPNTGVCALIDGRQVAVFRFEDAVFALDNRDPASGTNVLSRGIVGDVRGELVVASPLYKHHYNLATGRCLEDPDLPVAVHAARVSEGRVWVNTQTRRPVLRKGRRRLVVIGNGMAGMRTVEELLKLAPDTYDIAVFGAEPHGNYNRILLSPVLSGEKRVEEIMLHPREWYAEHGVTLHAGDEAIEVDRRKRTVRSRGGVQLEYDRLLFATGSKPIVLPVPGNDLPGVVTFRDLADVDSMLQFATRDRKAAVIGGGLLGLEAANGLRRRGMDVTVVHRFDSLMERQLDPAAAALLRASLESRGIQFRVSTQTVAVKGVGRVTGLLFEDGSGLSADLVVMAAGVRPNIELASRCGLRCDRGVLVDDTMQTYDPGVYAVGECVQHRNLTFGLVAPLWDQARVCAAHLAELGTTRYRATLPATHLKVSGVELYSAGDFLGGDPSEAIVLRDPKRGVYKRLVIRDNKLRGAVLFGDASDASWYFDMISGGRDIGPMRDTLLFGPGG
jgi:NAD(P)H-dependent nitrite reductase small subunit